MQLTKNPDPADGLFDISLLPNMPKWKVLKLLPSLFNSKVADYETVKTDLASSLRIQVTDSKKVVIQADGEIVGSGSFTVKLLPQALRFYV